MSVEALGDSKLAEKLAARPKERGPWLEKRWKANAERGVREDLDELQKLSHQIQKDICSQLDRLDMNLVDWDCTKISFFFRFHSGVDVERFCALTGSKWERGYIGPELEPTSTEINVPRPCLYRVYKMLRDA